MNSRSIYELRPRDFKVASVPQFSHAEWLSFAGVIPAGALCVSVGRTASGVVEYFVGDGVHRYADLPKFGGSGGVSASINGVALSGNKVSAELGLASSDAQFCADFAERWGSISLLDSPMSDWEDYVAWAEAEYAASGDQNFCVPYAGTKVVSVLVDSSNEFPLRWVMGNGFYGKNSSGIHELVFGGFEVTEEMRQFFNDAVIDGETF